jgi:hypothetical protein
MIQIAVWVCFILGRLSVPTNSLCELRKPLARLKLIATMEWSFACAGTDHRSSDRIRIVHKKCP